jgi:hypothetical protein
MNTPARVSRVCLDKFTNNLTVSLTVNDADACGSFQFHRVYGREDAAAPYVLLKQISTLNVSLISATVPNNKRWEIYISSHFACNGIDSLVSNRVLVDDMAPFLFEPDSVSVNYASQNLIAGWTKPSVNDIKGFSLFKENGGTNVLLKDTFSLFYSFAKSTFNPANFGTIKFSIAAFDSCLNGGILSSYHTPPFLSVQVDPNYYCSRKCSLLLSPYIGWASDSFWLYRFNTKTNQWKMVKAGIWLGASMLIVDSNLNLDVTYDYFFRCKKSGASLTSSSNRIAIQLPSLSKTNPPSLEMVSVNGNSLDILGNSGLLSPGFSYILEKRGPAGGWSVSSSFINSGLSATSKSINSNDLAVAVNSGYYRYRVVRQDNCGKGFDTSTIHTNIWLRLSGGKLFWNRYWGWLCATCSNSITYNLNRYNTLTSVWETVQSFQNTEDSFKVISGLWEGLQRFRVEATNNNNGSVSLSNDLVVDLGYNSNVKDTLLIPTAFTPAGLNPIFKISNPAISRGESTFDIYNRWGEQIWSGDAIEGWGGNDLRGNAVSDGVYVYQFTAVYRNKRVVQSGSVLLLK